MARRVAPRRGGSEAEVAAAEIAAPEVAAAETSAVAPARAGVAPGRAGVGRRIGSGIGGRGIRRPVLIAGIVGERRRQERADDRRADDVSGDGSEERAAD